MTTALSSASCGFEFVEGESYIVYAYANDEDDSGKLVASLCSRTKQLASASEDLKELGPSISAGTPTASPEVTSNHSGAGSNEPSDPAEKPAADSDSFPLVTVGISGMIIVLIVVVGAVLYRRRDGGTGKK